jgi:hypothetical protein
VCLPLYRHAPLAPFDPHGRSSPPPLPPWHAPCERSLTDLCQLRRQLLRDAPEQGDGEASESQSRHSSWVGSGGTRLSVRPSCLLCVCVWDAVMEDEGVNLVAREARAERSLLLAPHKSISQPTIRPINLSIDRPVIRVGWLHHTSPKPEPKPKPRASPHLSLAAAETSVRRRRLAYVTLQSLRPGLLPARPNGGPTFNGRAPSKKTNSPPLIGLGLALASLLLLLPPLLLLNRTDFTPRHGSPKRYGPCPSLRKVRRRLPSHTPRVASAFVLSLFLSRPSAL